MSQAAFVTLSRRAQLERQFAHLIGARYAAERALADAKLAGSGVEQAAMRRDKARRVLAAWGRRHADEINRLHLAGITDADRLNYRIAMLRTLRDNWQAEGKHAHARMADERLRTAVIQARKANGMGVVGV